MPYFAVKMKLPRKFERWYYVDSSGQATSAKRRAKRFLSNEEAKAYIKRSDATLLYKIVALVR